MTALYPWLAPTYNKITQAFQQGLGHHALLFRADIGVGVEQLVQQMAAFLFCQSNTESKPCKQCHACQLFTSGNHPDFHLLAPIDGKDIGVDQVREINEKVAQHSQQGGNKVVIVQGAERLTDAAANALLKTLEEPRPSTYFLLQTELSASLLATIHSRCQSWILPVPSLGMSQEWLQQQLSPNPNKQGVLLADIHTALRMNYGRPLLALATLTQGLIKKRLELLRAFWTFYQKCSPLELFPLLEKELIFQQIDWICSFLTDALKYKLGIHKGWVCQDIVKGVQQFSQNQNVQGLLKANQIMQKVRLDLSQINAVNQDLMVLDGLTSLVTDVFMPQIDNRKTDVYCR